MNATNNQKAVDLFNKLADSYQERFFSVDHYQEGLETFLSRLGDQARVLDIACGPGNISHFLLQRKPGLQITGIDLAPRMVQLAQANNPTAVFLVHDALEIDSLGPDNPDGIVIGFLFPYFSKPQVEDFLLKVHAKLKAGGLVYLSTMEDLYEHSRLRASSTGEQVMMHYYESAYLENQLSMLGFELLYKHRQPFRISDNEQDTDLILAARKIR